MIDGGPHKAYPGNINIIGMRLYSLSTKKIHECVYTHEQMTATATLLTNPDWQLAICHRVTYFIVSDKFNNMNRPAEAQILYIPTTDEMIVTTFFPQELMTQTIDIMRGKADSYVRMFITRLKKITTKV